MRVDQPTPPAPSGQTAAAVAVWPSADLERRVIRALDFAAVAVSDFGETGYADAVRPALGFGPEKVVAEATMLAYVAHGAGESRALRDRVDALAKQLEPLVRSQRALADMALNPDQVFRRAVPHVLLTALGHRDDAFDDFAADQCARVLSHAVDQPATVLAERRWVTTVWGRPLPPVQDAEFGTILTHPFDLLVGSREDPYAFTHLLFYVTDFGRAATAEAGRPYDEILTDVEALVIRYLDHGDYDLVGELLMAWPQLRQEWSPVAAFAFRMLAHVEDAVGVLPCGNVDPERLAALVGAERTRYARAASYHTALVMGFLCAVGHHGDAAPPTTFAGPQYSDEAWQTFRAMLDEHRGDWQPVFDRCTAAEKRTLTPMLCGLVITQALRQQNFTAMHEAVPGSLERHPAEVRALLGYEFFKVDPATGKVRELSQVFGPDAQQEYWMKLDDLAHDLCELLTRLNYDFDEPKAGMPNRPAVYLAETTGDMKEEHETIRRDLQQHGYTVLPAFPLPTIASEMKAVVEQQLAGCGLSIHLVGKNYSLVPEGGMESLVELQNNLAIERGRQDNFSRLVWIASGSEIQDERQQRLVERLRMNPHVHKGADILETSLDALRTIIQDRLRAAEKPAPPARAQEEDERGDIKQLYFIYDQRDQDAIVPWQNFLFEQGLEVIHPIFEGTEAEVREYHEENLRVCHGVMIFYGAANESWLRRKLREVQKSASYGRSEPLEVVSVCLASPRTPQKERFRTHEAKVIPQWESLSPESLLPFVQELKASRKESARLMRARITFNPFPGLRAFEPDEDHLFFGREKQIDELLRRLRQTRFLSVIGTSGSGKSSLVRSGLIPSLHSGFMVKAGSGWRVAIFRPGDDPIGHLASSLDLPDVLGTDGQMAETNRVLIEATLRRSTLGLVEAVRQARMPAHESLLVVVDQFEEMFRFRRGHGSSSSRNAAGLFVKLLLEAAQQNDVPIYIVLTMRSDFIGDCLEFPGLPEAINAGLYLVPRMTRDELRSAITGPVAVGGGEVSQRLVLRFLNDVGEDPDQLPVMQHALMRTWDYWETNHQAGEPLDIIHYEAIGTIRHALSLHAEEAFTEASSAHGEEITARMFKALTDTSTDSRGVRRPASVQELAAVCGRPEAEIISVVETFRRPGRSFLAPPHPVPLNSLSVIDLSHESLMRCWTRLIQWAEEERISAAYYERLAQAAAWYEEGSAGLWRDPELQLGLDWKNQHKPIAAWAHRYNPSFERAMQFLDLSEMERVRFQKEQERERKRKLRRAWAVSGALTVTLAISLFLGWIASGERTRAENNLQTAKRAVDEMLSSAGGDVARVAADVPQMEEFRRDLLLKARDFYSEFTNQRPDSEEFRKEMALAHFRLGEIHRLLRDTESAIEQYMQAIDQFETLAMDYPAQPEYRQLLANAYNWMAETQRPLENYGPEAEEAYDAAVGLQEGLFREFPDNTSYRQELARTRYNRGILRSDRGEVDDADFREAIRLLQELAGQEGLPAANQIQQELARTYNNLGRLLRRADRALEARGFYEQAIAIHNLLTRQEPENREYKLELATFHNNLAVLLEETGEPELANLANRQALELFQVLAEPAPSLALQIAHAHNSRGRILESQGLNEQAEREYEQSLRIFEGLDRLEDSTEYRIMYGQALFNMAALLRAKSDFQGSLGLLSRSVTEHTAANSQIDLGYDYLLMVQNHLDLRAFTAARTAAASLSRLLPDLPEPYRASLTAAINRLQGRLDQTEPGR